MTILVGYASAHGSTRGIAERIAAKLAGSGHDAEVQNLCQIDRLSEYDAYVLGSAVHNRAWLIEATETVMAGREMLRHRPVWLFSVGMPAALRGPWRVFADKEEPMVSARLREAIAPREHRLFSGVFRPEHISFFGRVLFRAMGCRYGDYRDWEAIDAWAEAIARQITAENPRPRTGGVGPA
ncbi:flavodoxin domain-containing protein [Actinomadura barringtoniae]|uniref:Flavodoxin domain-containing protein n=1 Tax=Actinomadura barringtoniae TaxID=1427535 RepID=A0A939PD98_9ACTN|nr:flavodoxin domain-containing protein [Actinomadura barringtoniae]MBO2447948.1 flavodoxin domain-containing protein [Actinomadura barringtoniae]